MSLKATKFIVSKHFLDFKSSSVGSILSKLQENFIYKKKWGWKSRHRQHRQFFRCKVSVPSSIPSRPPPPRRHHPRRPPLLILWAPQVRRPRKCKKRAGRAPPAPTPRSGEPSRPAVRTARDGGGVIGPRRRRCGASGCQEFSSPSLLFFEQAGDERAISSSLPFCLAFLLPTCLFLSSLSPVASLASAIKRLPCLPSQARTHARRLPPSAPSPRSSEAERPCLGAFLPP